MKYAKHSRSLIMNKGELDTYNEKERELSFFIEADCLSVCVGAVTETNHPVLRV